MYNFMFALATIVSTLMKTSTNGQWQIVRLCIHAIVFPHDSNARVLIWTGEAYQSLGDSDSLPPSPTGRAEGKGLLIILPPRKKRTVGKSHLLARLSKVAITCARTLDRREEGCEREEERMVWGEWTGLAVVNVSPAAEWWTAWNIVHSSWACLNPAYWGLHIMSMSHAGPPHASKHFNTAQLHAPSAQLHALPCVHGREGGWPVYLLVLSTTGGENRDVAWTFIFQLCCILYKLYKHALKTLQIHKNWLHNFRRCRVEHLL